MAGTLLDTITSSMRMRWRETYVSEGLNQKDLPFPWGIHRGFGVIPSGSAMSITIKADAVKGDQLAVHETLGTPKYSIGIHMTGDFDLSLAALPSQTVIVGIEVTYSTGVDSTSTINAYTLSQYASAAPGSIVVLAMVTTPASGTIPAGNISYTGRSSAWLSINPEAVGWWPIIKNGGFEAASSTVTGTVGMTWDSWRVDNAFCFAPSTTTPHSGVRNVLLRTTGSGTQTGHLHQWTRVPMSAGQHLRIRAYKKTLVQLVSGTAQLFVDWADVNGAYLSTSTSTFMDNTVAPDATYVLLDSDFVAPTSTAFAARVGVLLTGFSYGSAVSGAYVDDFQAYVQPLDALAAPAEMERRGDAVFSGLMIEDPNQVTFADAVALFNFSKSYRGGAGKLAITNRDGSDSPSIEAMNMILPAAGFVQGAFERLTMPLDQGQSYNLISSSGSYDAASAVQTYVYASAGGGGSATTGFVVAINAYFDGTNWNYWDSSTTTPAAKYHFSLEGFRAYTYAAGQTATWADSAWTPIQKNGTAWDYPQITEPAAPPVNTTGRFFFRSNGVSSPNQRTQMCVKWGDGTVTVIAESNTF